MKPQPSHPRNATAKALRGGRPLWRRAGRFHHSPSWSSGELAGSEVSLEGDAAPGARGSASDPKARRRPAGCSVLRAGKEEVKSIWSSCLAECQGPLTLGQRQVGRVGRGGGGGTTAAESTCRSVCNPLPGRFVRQEAQEAKVRSFCSPRTSTDVAQP